jgi:hypothetical protein
MANEIWLPHQPATSQDLGGSVNQVGVYLPVTAVFPDTTATKENLEVLLAHLSRTDALFWCARLNLIVSNPSYPDHLNKQRYGLHNFFSQEEIRRIATFASEHRGPLTVFFRGQLLELMRWICLFSKDSPDDGLTFDDAEARRTFAKAALIVSDLLGWRTWQDKMNLDEGVEAARRRSLGGVRVAYDAVTDGLDPMMAIGRGRSLFRDHFAHFHPSFSDEFRSRMDLDLDEFYAVLCIVAVHYLNRTPEIVVESTDKSGIFLLKEFADLNPKLASISERYFSKASQTADELRDSLWPVDDVTAQDSLAWRDFRAIRDRPILRTPDGRAIVLDPVFFAESAAVGPLFAILPRDKTKGNVILTRFGEAFESYTSAVLRRMYPKPKGDVVDRLTCNLVGTDKRGNQVQIADACLNNEYEVVLFESKATWIREDIVEHRDPEEYVRVLCERYSKRSDDQPKGVGQLAKAITNLASGEWRLSNQDFTLARNVYPVVIAYDPRLDGAFHSHFLANEFRAALAPNEIRENGEMRKGRFLVAPLIVLTIENLENLERSVEHFGLVELFRDYSVGSPDRMLSLHNFLAFSAYGKKLFASGSLAESALKVLAVAKEIMSSMREAQEEG